MSFTPHPALREVVSAIQVIEDGPEEVRVLPSAATVLGFQYRGRVRTPFETLTPAGITGIQRTAQDYAYEPSTASVLVRFTAQGASCLGVSADALAESRCPLDALLPVAAVRQVAERLAEAANARERVDAVESLLRELPFTRDRLIERAQQLLGASERASVAEAARTVGLSERQLERRFLARIGITPKRFASLRRFERAVSLSASARSLSELALDAGYFDQSHFIREVRAYTGLTPGALFGVAS